MLGYILFHRNLQWRALKTLRMLSSHITLIWWEIYKEQIDDCDGSLATLYFCRRDRGVGLFWELWGIRFQLLQVKKRSIRSCSQEQALGLISDIRWSLVLFVTRGQRKLWKYSNPESKLNYQKFFATLLQKALFFRHPHNLPAIVKWIILYIWQRLDIYIRQLIQDDTAILSVDCDSVFDS